TFAASAEDVFDAWTSPEVMRRWFHCAPDWETPEAEVDLRVGGKVRVAMRRPDGTEVEAEGANTLRLGSNVISRRLRDSLADPEQLARPVRHPPVRLAEQAHRRRLE